MDDLFFSWVFLFLLAAAICADAFREDREVCFSAGFDAFLARPMTPEALETADT